MKKIDDATLSKWKSEAAEKRELLIRKKWLLQKHPDFKKELQEVALAAGKSLKCKGSFVDNGINRTMILDCLHWDNLKELDKHGTPRHAFMVQYDLIPEPPGAGALTWELAKLRKLKKAASWGGQEKFWKDAEWYELSQQGKSDWEIVEEMKNKMDWIPIDMHALAYWKKKTPENFKKLHMLAEEKLEKFKMLCRIAKTKPDKQKLLNLKLLYLLGRFILGRAKGNFGPPAREYPPFDGGSEELQTDRLYLVHTHYEWPEQLFSQQPDLETTKELKNLRNGGHGFLSCLNEYADKNYTATMRGSVRQQLSRMKKKIEKTYEFYQKNL